MTVGLTERRLIMVDVSASVDHELQLLMDARRMQCISLQWAPWDRDLRRLQ